MDLLKFLAIVVPFGTVAHMIGWWRGYRKAIAELKESESEPLKPCACMWDEDGVRDISDCPRHRTDQVHNSRGCHANGAAHLGPCIVAPAPDISSYSFEPISEGWLRKQERRQ